MPEYVQVIISGFLFLVFIKNEKVKILVHIFLGLSFLYTGYISVSIAIIILGVIHEISMLEYSSNRRVEIKNKRYRSLIFFNIAMTLGIVLIIFISKPKIKKIAKLSDSNNITYLIFGILLILLISNLRKKWK